MRGFTHLAIRFSAATAILLCLVATAAAAPPVNAPIPTSIKNLDYTTFIDANALLMFMDNTGSFAYDKTQLLGRYSGLYFPRFTQATAMYAGGLWVGAKVNGQLRVSVAEYSDEYVPGPMAGGTYQPDQPSFRVYKIRAGDTPLTNPDYAQWPIADGAPFTLDEHGVMAPLLLGKQALWTVFNDADPSAHGNDAGNTPPLGIEVQLYAFGDDLTCEENQTVFLYYTIINKSPNVLEDAYLGLWSDPDLGSPTDDLVGCDTLLSLGYCYNDGPDDIYGPHPPAVGIKFLQGPLVPSPGDSVWVLSKGGWVHDYRNLSMVAFNKYINGEDPHNAEQSYNYLRGLTANGGVRINPVTGMPTTFMFSGDPITGTGWIDINSDDRRLMLSVGPVTMAPGDTQYVAAAVLIGATAGAEVYNYERIQATHPSGASVGHVHADVLDPTTTTGHDYRVTFHLADSEDHYEWNLTDVNTGLDVLTDQENQTGDSNYAIADGLKTVVTGPRPGVGSYEVPSYYQRFTSVNSDIGFEGYRGSIGWMSPYHLYNTGPPGVPMSDLKPVLLKFAATDQFGIFHPNDEHASYGYRYGRAFQDPPARPEFIPYIVNPSPFYSFQDFTINVPLSAWDISVDPPRRLAVGFLENNQPNGSVDGRYWPPDGYERSNIDGSGPREWLFIYDADYSETLDPTLAVDAVDNPLPIMYWLTVSRAGDQAFQFTDEFLIRPMEGYNTESDIFDFTAPPPSGPADPDVVVCAPGIPGSSVAEIKRVAAEIQDQYQATELPPSYVAIDILPGECPNWLHPELPDNPRRIIGNLSAGVRGPSPVRVAVLGSETVDVTALDPLSFMFEGVAPDRYAYDDVAAPVVKESPCDCRATLADGFTDLVLQYNRDDLFEAITSEGDFDLLNVHFDGWMKSGRPVAGSDCLHILKPVNTTLAAGAQTVPTRLDGNYPNPFNAHTVIRFNLQQPADARVEIFDVLGRRVSVLVDEALSSGPHQIEWDGTDTRGNTVASGMYFYRLTAGEYVATKKMVMLK